ncbi:hypothetical protein TNCV_3110691 [Trichonephila clavipes]|nr:hypothetical protein TNCV_3110691 [Trichonephila clavipes]
MSVLIILTPESTIPRTTLSTVLIVESMIRLTTSVSTIESPIIHNTLTLKSIELSPWSAIVRVSIVTSRFPPIFPPIPVRETIVLAWNSATFSTPEKYCSGKIQKLDPTLNSGFTRWAPLWRHPGYYLGHRD